MIFQEKKMDWKHFFKIMLRNAVVTIALTTLVLGSIGFLFAGQDGLVSGASWGLIIGAISIPFMAGIIYMKYWGDFAGRYSEWYVEKETKGE
jgi:hypothetical protein